MAVSFGPAVAPPIGDGARPSLPAPEQRTETQAPGAETAQEPAPPTAIPEVSLTPAPAPEEPAPAASSLAKDLSARPRAPSPEHAAPRKNPAPVGVSRRARVASSQRPGPPTSSSRGSGPADQGKPGPARALAQRSIPSDRLLAARDALAADDRANGRRLLELAETAVVFQPADNSRGTPGGNAGASTLITGALGRLNSGDVAGALQHVNAALVAVDGPDPTVEGGPNPGHFDATGCWLQAPMVPRPKRC